ncbi:MAG: hypothetical protein NWS86_05420 [Flavobacteriales bacterium]|jgi:hypothetical protein|nr:hypothetical protein [Flavobacteriales bacterium]
MANMLAYPVKIIIAWGEAISGNGEIRDWLIKNGYPELGLFAFAVRNNDEARKWLLDNKFPELLALINGAEGNAVALQWLKLNKYDLLHTIALAADNDDTAMAALGRLPEKEWFIIASKIRVIKNEIEAKNNDVHGISSN